MKNTTLVALATFLCWNLSVATASDKMARANYLSVFEDTTKMPPKDWQLLDATLDKIRGVSSERAYEQLLKNKKGKPVIVAVIDSGVDIEHEDLKDIIWVNEKEIPGNGIDDDGNGYVDDVYGWNFIGGKNGEHVNQDTYELTREYVKFKNKWEGKSTSGLSKEEQAELAYYQEIKAKFQEKKQEYQQGFANYQTFLENFKTASRLIAAYLDVEEEELDGSMLAMVNSSDEKIKRSVALLSYAFEVGLTMEQLEEGVKYFTDQVKYSYNEAFDPRHIVGDDYEDLTNRFYGNNDVKGPDAEHGTHVAGIIAASRANDLGMQGIADQVRIMAIRAVPNGDERDKDVANAIRYAVDNGAKIINMSFGKAYSPQKAYVDEAIRYAESKGVLLIHAAGNDAKNLDKEPNFPNRRLIGAKKEASNWLEIGASSWGDEMNFVGDFSNYGKKSVDLFAPGVDIFSTIPGNGYKSNSGTSMAAPVVSGVAALLMSYYPELSVDQVRSILIRSTVKYENLKIKKPGGGAEEAPDEMVKFSELSITGGLINAYEALKMAEAISLKGKKK
jgi:subtilisin family serine protease